MKFDLFTNPMREADLAAKHPILFYLFGIIFVVGFIVIVPTAFILALFVITGQS